MKNGEGELAVDQCTKALQIREEVDVLCDRAEAYLLNDLFAEGIKDNYSAVNYGYRPKVYSCNNKIKSYVFFSN